MQKKITNHKQLVEAIKNHLIDNMDVIDIELKETDIRSSSFDFLNDKYQTLNDLLKFILSAEKDIK